MGNAQTNVHTCIYACLVYPCIHIYRKYMYCAYVLHFTYCPTLEIPYTVLSKNFSILPGLCCPVESANEILRHISKTRYLLCGNMGSYCPISIYVCVYRTQGGELWSLTPDSLLDYRDYQQWLLDSHPSLSLLPPARTEEEFQERSGQAWTYLLLQIMKVHVYNHFIHTYI